MTIAYQMGSVGTGLARADRLTGGLAWVGRRVAGGAWAIWILGLEDRGDREALMVEAWARGEPVVGLLLGARFVHFIRNLEDGGDSLSELTATVGYRVVDPLRVFLAVDRTFAGESAAPSLPGYERWALRVVGELTI